MDIGLVALLLCCRYYTAAGAALLPDAIAAMPPLLLIVHQWTLFAPRRPDLHRGRHLERPAEAQHPHPRAGGGRRGVGIGNVGGTCCACID